MNGQLTNLKTTIADPHQDHLILSERQHQSKFKAMDSPSGSLSPVAIDLAGVSKSYGGKIVVNDLSFTIAAGECFGLLGPNGAGKSTITRMILGMTSPNAGKITVLGAQEPGQVRLARAKIGIVSQFDNLDLEFTVRENLLVYGRYFRMSTREIETVIPSLLEFARLESKANTRVADLSGGMKRRLTLARALINDPQLLILDEPTTGLDPHARHLIWERLRSLLACGKTILLTTHIMEEAERLCDRLCVLEAGRKIAEGRPHALIEEQIGCPVIEIYGGDPQELSLLIRPNARRLEISGETLFCYTPDPEQVRAQLRRYTGLRLLERPPNLEDVFLRLTGREMEK
ncbi:nodulation factor ABC transporter ATP-binding protein NodI [Rhizobium leguminosarum bv. viciae]|uniref:Nodulation factor ABC transporter ATP-binding protein NodI n=4 Tax=Rhizobium TaxID=379 RepID=A0A8I2KJH7_RHILV|nr:MULTISPECIES: nodulation factor ABC transporter ATP-binding protein NodI [Rhizobium]MBX4863516.1 nodulation factor ABC transporter ATP-binding protein NodI [Rhizobium bangladeshense]MBA1344253.1 nodulation factor ABC transporter ATP-binding protein NodI [Rhizobium sp. WYCCWR 11146]MBX5173465.1 nodulation factor ABC transporter ATP-binding protein NodI [Rhizobium sp. NZLR1b]MBX5186975.1 nodulation factor ABC transporter ATP-binding protein NodI [Rhizobium sp. NZLR5]MBX5196818.1 nodulation fa